MFSLLTLDSEGVVFLLFLYNSRKRLNVDKYSMLDCYLAVNFSKPNPSPILKFSQRGSTTAWSIVSKGELE